MMTSTECQSGAILIAAFTATSKRKSPGGYKRAIGEPRASPVAQRKSIWKQCRSHRSCGFRSLVQKIPWRKAWQVQFSSVTQSCLLLVTPWTAACQASLSITNSRTLLKLMSIESQMPSSHLILCHPFFLPPSIFPSIKVFVSKSVLHIRWPKIWSFSFSISPSNEYSGLISFSVISLV